MSAVAAAALGLVLGIPTRRRWPALFRLLRGLEADTASHELARLVIADDGTPPAQGQAVRGALGRWARQRGLPFSYVGAGEKMRLAEHLGGAGFPRDLVDFAIGPRAAGNVGANRNCLLLHSAGRLLLCVDDDVTLAVLARPGAPAVDPELADNAYDIPASFFPSREAALAEVRPTGESLLALHAQLLGAPIPASAPPVEPGPGSGGAGLVAKFDRGRGRIGAVVTGYVGDSGWPTQAGALLATGSERAALLASQGHFAACMASRQIVRIPAQTVVTPSTFCAGAALGMDHRRIAAPFPPLERGEDDAWGTVTRVCFPSDYLAHLARGVAHLPGPRPGPRMREALGRPSTPGTAAWLVAAASSATPALGISRSEALRRVGRHLYTIAGGSPADFAAVVWPILVRTLSLTADALDGAIKDYGGQPGFWARDCRRLELQLRRSAASDPPPLGRGHVTAACAREFVALYGRLLISWPDLACEAARAIGRAPAEGRPIQDEPAGTAAG